MPHIFGPPLVSLLFFPLHSWFSLVNSIPIGLEHWSLPLSDACDKSCICHEVQHAELTSCVGCRILGFEEEFPRWWEYAMFYTTFSMPWWLMPDRKLRAYWPRNYTCVYGVAYIHAGSFQLWGSGWTWGLILMRRESAQRDRDLIQWGRLSPEKRVLSERYIILRERENEQLRQAEWIFGSSLSEPPSKLTFISVPRLLMYLVLPCGQEGCEVGNDGRLLFPRRPWILGLVREDWSVSIYFVCAFPCSKLRIASEVSSPVW